MGRDTIRSYIKALERARVLDGPATELPELDTLRVLIEEHAPTTKPPQQRSSIDRWEAAIDRLRKGGAGPTAIHDYLRLNESEYTGSLSAIKRMYLRLDKVAGPSASDVAIPVVTAPGQIGQVDFGYVGMIYDPERGVLRKAWVFIMTLGFSRLMFLEIVFDQKIETWLQLHIAAFEHFGGVPAVIVPDNLKAAVIRAAFGVDDDAELNRSYRELARHYGFQVDPTPPRSPQKKGKVERDVRYVKGNFFKTWTSVDIVEARRQLARWNQEIASKRKHETTGRAPIELFEEQERTALLPLPKSRWEKVIWKRAKLHSDSHVQIDGAFYSANWKHLHQELWARCSQHSIALYLEDRHLRTHSRVPRGQRSTFDDDLPPHRSDLAHRSQEYWEKRSRAMGPEVLRLVFEIFAADDVLLRLRRVQSIVTHLEGFPRERAQATAQRALHFGCTDYASIKNILKKGLDLEPLPEASTRKWSRGSHFARTPAQLPPDNNKT